MFELNSSPECPSNDDIPRFEEERKSLEKTWGETVVPENLNGKMLVGLEGRNAVNHMVGRTQYRLREGRE